MRRLLFPKTLILVLVGIALTAFAAPAQAKVQKFPVTAVKRGVIVFKLHGIDARSVVRVSAAGRRMRHLGLRQARRAIRRGRLRVTARSLGLSRSVARKARRDARVIVGTDTTPPETKITSGPSATLATTSASFGFKSSEKKSTFRCSIDGAATASCANPAAYSGLSQGSHTFGVAAIDRFGNTDPSPATRFFTVATTDTTDPGTTGSSTSSTGASTSSTGASTSSTGASTSSTGASTSSTGVGGGGGVEGCGLGIFSPGSWPASCWQPYSDTSPFNSRLPASPRLLSDSAQIVGRLAGWGKAQNFLVGHPESNSSDYGHPVYYASLSDPLYTIHCTRWTSSCKIEGMQVRIPAAAKPANGGDAHMAVIDQANGWEYDFWQLQTVPLPAGGGTINISHGGRTRWGTSDAEGLGSNATAAHFALGAGVIRAEEWEAAVARGGAIEHALFMVVKCSGGYSVFPAAPGTTAASCSRFGATNDAAPPVGAHFYLDMSDAQIDSLSVPAWKKPILKAMAHYGMFVGDTFNNNNNSFALMAESDVQYRAVGEPGRYATLGRKWGVGTYNGAYVFDIQSGVDWARYLKVVDPCVAQGSC